MSTSQEYTVQRIVNGRSSGCDGAYGYYEDDRPGVGHIGVYPSDILGYELGSGTRVRVTIEVLDEVAPPAVCQNPWHRAGEYPHRPESGDQNPNALPLPARQTEESS